MGVTDRPGDAPNSSVRRDATTAHRQVEDLHDRERRRQRRTPGQRQQHRRRTRCGRRSAPPAPSPRRARPAGVERKSQGARAISRLWTASSNDPCRQVGVSRMPRPPITVISGSSTRRDVGERRAIEHVTVAAGPRRDPGPPAGRVRRSPRRRSFAQESTSPARRSSCGVATSSRSAGRLQVGAHGDQRARRMPDQRAQIPVAETRSVPAVFGIRRTRSAKAVAAELERRDRGRHDDSPAISSQPSTDSGLRGPGPT